MLAVHPQAGYSSSWTETEAEEEIGLNMDWDMANQGCGPGTMDEGSGCLKTYILMCYRTISFVYSFRFPQLHYIFKQRHPNVQISFCNLKQINIIYISQKQ